MTRVALIGNMAATGAILWVLVATLGPVWGAHFNRAVTLAFLVRGEIALPRALACVLARFAGALLATSLAAILFLRKGDPAP